MTTLLDICIKVRQAIINQGLLAEEQVEVSSKGGTPCLRFPALQAAWGDGPALFHFYLERERLSYSTDRRVSRPRTKSGYNYQDIAVEVVNHVKRGDRGARGRAQAEALRQELKLPQYGELSLLSSEVEKQPVLVNYTLNKAMTVDQARDLVMALRSLGLIE